MENIKEILELLIVLSFVVFLIQKNSHPRVAKPNDKQSEF